MPETLDSLAAKFDSLTTVVHDGFQRTDERFEQIDKRFEQIDERFEQVDKRFEQIDQQFEQVGQRFGQVGERIDSTRSELRTLIEAVDAKVGLVLERVEDLVTRDGANREDHKRFEQRLQDHDVRILALESPRKAGR